MYEKIETKEIMTHRAAREKYRTQYFLMVLTEEVDGGDNDLGYVVLTANTENEYYDAPTEEYRGKGFMLLNTLGVAAEPYPIIGNVVYHA